MGRNLNDIIKALPKDRQEKINSRAEKLIAEYETLQELRRALNVTQVEMADEMGVAQESISRMEKRRDMLLSTLVRAIAGLGGKLDLTVHFKDKPSVSLGRLVDASVVTPARDAARTRHRVAPVAKKAVGPAHKVRRKEHA